MIGTLLHDRYHLESELGRGGMGVVYRAHDTLLGRDVAVKVLSSTSLGTEGRARLLREAQAAAQLNHPNIVTVHDAGEAGGTPFIVMELVEGGSLRDHAPETLERTLAIARQLCAALEHAHAHGIVHRDLKPGNVLIASVPSLSPSEGEGPGVRVKLADFGLARTADSQLTTEGTIVGTVSYLAPEQAMGEAIDHRVDLYALGVVLYEWTAGQLPFTGDDPLAVISQHLHAPVIPPRARVPEIPPALDALIVRLLSKRPRDRPASATEVRQRLEELSGPGAIPAAPPPQLLEEPPNNLPAQVTPFIGRERELSQLAAQIADPETRLVTVVGPGGMGKTRLALEAARQLLISLPSAQAGFPAGAWLVELAPVGDPGEVPLAVASALGAHPPPGREPTDTIVDSLQTRELLLVLDNCEHLLEGVARLVSHLISRCPQLTVLATSREALRIPGEQLVEMPPMALSLPGTDSVLAEADVAGALGADAVRLFAARAAAVRPGFAVDEGNAAHVATICRRLDGMPLAIELAAARLRALSLQDVAARLDDRFALLDRGSRVAEPRQQTLSNAVAWSYDLLDRAEQTLFDRLSVFRGGFTLSAAEGVCAGGGVPKGAVLDLLADLVDKSMVAVRGARDGVGETRYELLETMRQYAGKRLAERGEADAVSGRHARHYAAFAEQVDPQLHAWDDWVTPIRRLNAEVDNLATAVRWSLAKGQPEFALRIGGALREWTWTHPYGQQFWNWTQTALEADAGVAPQVRAKALNTLAMWAWGEGDAGLGQELAEEAALLAGRAEDPKVLLRALYELGRHMFRAGQHERAAALFAQSREIALECGHHIGAIEASTWLAELQELQERRVWLEGLLPQAPYMWQAYIHQLLGGTCRQLGDLAAAERHFAQALEGWGKAEILPTQSITLSSLGMIAMLRVDDERASGLLQQALDLGRRCGHVPRVLDATVLLGELAWRRGDLDTALQRWREALALAREHDRFGHVLGVRLWLAHVACARGDYDRAEKLVRTSLEGYAEHEEFERAEATMALARVALFRGAPTRAVELYRASLPGVWPAEWISTLRALEGLGWALTEDGDHDRAARLLAAVARERKRSGACLPPIDRPRQARVIAALRRALGEGAFAAAWAEGEALTTEQAVAYALRETPT